MCGIAGFVGGFDQTLLKQMTDVIAHRGPDGEGQWYSEDNTVALGHRRLSIIDLSDAAKQPMLSQDSRYTVVFNGEIYNFHQLAKEMQERGYEFNENSDTAILAPLYDCFGPKMLDSLDGIFAFAIWDNVEKTLFAARDHLGIKPFYYSKTEKGLLFASEIKALLQETTVDKEINPEGLFAYLTYLWSPGAHTMLKSVKKLLPGHYMLIEKSGEYQLHEWYKTPQPELINSKPKYNKQTSPSDVLNLLDEVVNEQLVSDVPLGTFLSGGVDSSAIAASIALQDERTLQAFCMRFNGDASMKEEGFSEDIEYARQVAAAYPNIHLNEVTVDSTCLDGLEEMVYFLDEPQADPAPLYVREISKQARDQGIKVLMSGTGGDDIFSGYRRHHVTNFMHKMRFVPHICMSSFASLLNRFPVSGGLKRRFNKLSGLLQNTDIEKALIESFHYTSKHTLFGLLEPEWKQRYLDKQVDHLETSLSETKGQHPLNQQLYMEQHGFLPDHNLNYTDKLGMAEGMEIRVPLLDKRMLDMAATLPPQMKIKGNNTKYIFKKALEGRLSKDVLYRSKAGFGAPMRQWLTTVAADKVEELLFSRTFEERGIFNISNVKTLWENTKNGTQDGAYTLFSLMVIELWFRQFIDQSPTKHVN